MAGPWEKYQQSAAPWTKYQPWQPTKRSAAETLAHAQEYRQAHPEEATGSFLQNFAAGAGKSLVDTGQGLQQLYANVADYVAPEQQNIAGLVSGQPASRSAQIQQQVDQRRNTDQALMNTWGGTIGNVAGQVGQLAIPVGDVAKVGSWAGRAAPIIDAAIQGGAFSAAQPVGSGETRLGNAATGAAYGAGGQLVLGGVAKAAQNARAAMNPEVSASIQAARSRGIPLHVSQVTDSKAIKTLSSSASYLPFSGSAKAAGAQQEAFNRAVGRTFGTDAPVLSDQVMNTARSNLGKAYDQIFSRNNVAIQPADLRSMAAIERSAHQDLTSEEAAVVSNQFQKILNDFQNGQVTGSKYQSLRESLRKAADKTPKGEYIKALRQELDNVAARSVGPQDAQALKQLNSMYANFKTTQDALKQVSGAAGNVKPASLYPLVRKGSTGEMRTLAKIGQNVLKDPIPDSGTAARQIGYHALGFGGGGAAAVGGMAALGPLAKLVAGGAIAGRTLNSNAASKLLEQGKPLTGLSRLLQPLPRALPAAANAGLLPSVPDRVKKKKKP